MLHLYLDNVIFFGTQSCLLVVPLSRFLLYSCFFQAGFASCPYWKQLIFAVCLFEPRNVCSLFIWTTSWLLVIYLNQIMFVFCLFEANTGCWLFTLTISCLSVTSLKQVVFVCCLFKPSPVFGLITCTHLYLLVVLYGHVFWLFVWHKLCLLAYMKQICLLPVYLKQVLCVISLFEICFIWCPFIRTKLGTKLCTVAFYLKHIMCVCWLFDAKYI